MKLFPKQVRVFQKTIWSYYRKHKREFPWRQRSFARKGGEAGTRKSMFVAAKSHNPLSISPLERGRGKKGRNADPYSVLVSEVMLQQTQVDRVIPKYIAWMQQFPNPETLAKAPLKKVLRAWSGLGYNRRALYLKRAAEIIVREHGGEVPRDVEKLDALPGVGPYTAAAILAFAWNEPVIFIETNIRAVYLHFFFKGKREVRDEEILEVVGQTLPRKHHPTSILPSKEGRRQTSVREWYSALMDYGAMLKKTRGNLNTQSVHYAKQKKFAGSRRELRGEILRRAAQQETIVPGEFASDAFSVPEIFAELAREGFLRREGRVFKLK